ncbi:MAG: elongation factor P [Nitrospinota bacterium]|nr:elongation factor P [Nitrospinota bacterium]
MAAYISGNGIRPGFVIVYNKELYRVMKAEHRTPGNLRAFCQAKLRSLKNGNQTEVKFRADEQVERASLEQAEMEYLYSDTSGYCFMNSQTYEQIFIEDDIIADAKKFLIPNIKVKVEFYEEKPIGLELPETVEMIIEDTEPQMKGATASGSGKPATLETGLVVTVPQFIGIGEKIRVSTSSGEYLERVKE